MGNSHGAPTSRSAVRGANNVRKFISVFKVEEPEPRRKQRRNKPSKKKNPYRCHLPTASQKRRFKSIHKTKPDIALPEVHTTISRMPRRSYHHFLTCALLSLMLLMAPPGGGAQDCSNNIGCFPEVFDIVENIASFPARTYSVSGTCGLDPPATVQYRSLLTTELGFRTCDPAQNGPSNLVDDQAADAILVRFYVPNVQDRFNSVDARPQKMAIEKLDANGTAWTPLLYLASDCATSYPGIPLFDPLSVSNQYDTLYCRNHFGEESFFDGDNEIIFSPGFLYDANRNLLKNDPDAIAHFTTSGIRLYIEEPASLVPDKSYVMISDVVIDVRCSCSGHASVCGGPNGATCQCSHNTTGDQCSSCLPLHNNKQWEIGTTSDANACELCSCNGLANACAYDEGKGYGVCSACGSNTAGDFCETCVEGYYINPAHVNDSSVPYCLPCACSPDGTLPSALTTCEVTTGQCACKERVEGRDCSVCKDTFWAIAEAKPLGCDVCSCNAGGSIGSINLCDKITGRCLCKTNVQGDTCDTCKTATFNFDPSNPDGCTACECDPGASLSAACHTTTGQCDCRTAIGARDCSTPSQGFFVPKMDLVILEPEEFTSENVVLRSGSGTAGATVSGRGFVNLSPANQIDITFTSQYSGPMSVVVRYEIPSTDTIVVLQGSLDLISPTGYSCSGQVVPAGQNWQLLYSNVRFNLRGGVVLGTVCVNQGSVYTVRLNNPNSAFLVDSVILMPTSAGLESALSGRVDQAEVTRCVQQTVDVVMSNRVNCSSVEYSAMAAFLDGATACSCAAQAAVTSQVCDPTSGACPCRPGVLAPGCTQCQVDAHSFNQATGCTECGCSVTGSVSDTCSDTGDCDCLPNVVGAKCNACDNEHYGLATGQGCTLCQCDPTYAVNNNCNDQGECLCKVGVAGPLCQACLDGYYNLSPQGCTRCSCNSQGSTDRSCNATTGVCQCLPNVEGNNCDSCKIGYFGLGTWHPGGCLPCFCWNHGQECSSAPRHYRGVIERAWPTQTPADKWLAQQGEGSEGNSSAQVDMVALTTRAGFSLRINEASRAEYDIFLLADATFLGDRGSSYGRSLTVVVIPSPPPTSLTFTPSESRAERGYDVILQGQDCALGYAWNASALVAFQESSFEASHYSVLV
ncbi:laminin subunit beta-1 [Elysia marginata]|uniref:Laminin subunit beta-1 n=1 Tax=Elysia marginata TaxID=1093978 RepID=A0AAV4H3L8_9GAST|nr:laminin subunit beta-1 [Elysia marginata]